MPDKDLKERVEAVDHLTSLFKVERYIYLSIIFVCLMILLVSVGLALFGGKEKISNQAFITSMFGSGGILTAMTGRLLHMWNRAMDLIDVKKQAS
ncbi:MAG: hypothetical protein ACE5HS_18370 [bacterium]